MPGPFTTNMPGPYAVQKLNELWNAAGSGGGTPISDDPDNATVIGSDLGIYTPTAEAQGSLMATARLAEFDTEEKKAAVRANIGLEVIDGGTFF